MSERLIADLERLVPIASIGALSDHRPNLKVSADTVVQMLKEVGCEDARVVEGPWAPAVVAHIPGPPCSPTVCFYAHHDVQPLGDGHLWNTEPLDVALVGDRLFGRGTADDKGGIACHVETLRAFDGHPPVGVTLFIEGEEEIGSPHIMDFLNANEDLIKADVFVICDAGNWRVGEPAFTTSLRGVCDCVVTVSTLDHAVHSGQFGGPVPDALTALCRLLATLHDDDGNVAIEGLTSANGFGVEMDEDRFREDSGLVDGVELIGDGPLSDRLWAKPSATVIGLDAVSVEQSSNTLLPSARAAVSVRVPPSMKSSEALDALVRHLETHAPWGAKVDVVRGAAGNPSVVPTDGPIVKAGVAAYELAFGRSPLLVGMGGAIPLVGELHHLFPEAEFLVTGIADPDARMHSPNESVSLSDLDKTVQAQVEFLKALTPKA